MEKIKGKYYFLWVFGQPDRLTGGQGGQGEGGLSDGGGGGGDPI